MTKYFARPRRTWKTMSTSKPTMNAAYKLEKPVVQKPSGIDFPLSKPSVTDSVQSCPPFSHSQLILSFLRSK